MQISKFWIRSRTVTTDNRALVRVFIEKVAALPQGYQDEGGCLAIYNELRQEAKALAAAYND